jgi:hypothetical protein
MATGPTYVPPFGQQPEAKPRAIDKLKEAWNENPLMVIAIVGAALAGAGKFIDASGSVVSKWAYARRIKR